MFAVFIFVFVTLAPCSIAVIHTAPSAVTFKHAISINREQQIKVTLVLSHSHLLPLCHDQTST